MTNAFDLLEGGYLRFLSSSALAFGGSKLDLNDPTYVSLS